MPSLNHLSNCLLNSIFFLNFSKENSWWGSYEFSKYLLLQDAMRLHNNFYSMWSGSEHLPFIRLPESQEPQDGSDEDSSTDKSGFYIKPT